MPPLLLLLLFAVLPFGFGSADFSDFGPPLPHDTIHRRVKRQMYSLGARWVNNQVNFYFANTNEENKKIMMSAINYIGNRTCIKFKEDANAEQRVQLNAAPMNGCSSKIGAPGTSATMRGESVLKFGNCAFMGNMVHELSHALGSIHEHNRPDRDDKLTVDAAEVKRRGLEADMNPDAWGATKIYVPFDYGSVMLYDVYRYGEKIMTPKEPKYERTMGNRRVGFYDIQKINKHYTCKCDVDLPCDNGGYTNPSDCSKCVCPSGFFGKLCNERQAIDSFELAAGETWQSVTVQFNYTSQMGNYGYFHSTYVFINAPNNKTVEIVVERMEDFVCQYGCNQNGVEIKTNKDIKSVSPIICCPDQTFAQEPFKSTNNPTIIEMYSKLSRLTTFGFRFRYV